MPAWSKIYKIDNDETNHRQIVSKILLKKIYKNPRQNSFSNKKIHLVIFILLKCIISHCGINHLFCLFCFCFLFCLVTIFHGTGRTQRLQFYWHVYSWLSLDFIFRLFLTNQIPIAIIMTEAKQQQIIKETIPQNEFSEPIVSVVVLRAIVVLCDRGAIKLVLVS